MKIVYVAGPYRAETAWEIDKNIQSARAVGAEVARLGAMPLIPHSNTSHFDGLMPDQFWLDGTLEILRRCDAVLLMPHWRTSAGTIAEWKEAYKKCIPAFHSLLALKDWLLTQ